MPLEKTLKLLPLGEATAPAALLPWPIMLPVPPPVPPVPPLPCSTIPPEPTEPIKPLVLWMAVRLCGERCTWGSCTALLALSAAMPNAAEMVRLVGAVSADGRGCVVVGVVQGTLGSCMGLLRLVEAVWIG